MTTLTEEARWARLRAALEARFDAWAVPASDDRAAEIVRDLRRSGWRIPIPADYTRPGDWNLRSEWPGNRKGLDPERVRQHADACREALRERDADQ